MSMTPRRRIPRVNLFAGPPRVLSSQGPLGLAEIGAIGCGVLVFGAITFAIGLLLGWHPQVRFGQ
jgi:hypothetical protein